MRERFLCKTRLPLVPPGCESAWIHTGLLRSWCCDTHLWCLKYSTVPKKEGGNSMLPAKLLSKHFATGAAPSWFQGAWLGGSSLQGSCLCYTHSLLAGKLGAKMSLM